MNAAHLLIATGNRHKVDEIAAILRDLLPAFTWELRSAADFPHVPEPVEDGDTFAANAAIKARGWAMHPDVRAVGLAALADDSGLVVDALAGRPGILSARYGATPTDRIERVLREMRDVGDSHRSARFECVVALADGGGALWTARGTVEGRITHAPRGMAGFGYDPIFELTDGPHAGLTLAEVPESVKNGLSHRARALRALAPTLAAMLRPAGV